MIEKISNLEIKTSSTDYEITLDYNKSSFKINCYFNKEEKIINYIQKIIFEYNEDKKCVLDIIDAVGFHTAKEGNDIFNEYFAVKFFTYFIMNKIIKDNNAIIQKIEKSSNDTEIVFY